MTYNAKFTNLTAWTDPSPDQSDVFRVDPNRVNVNSRFQYRHRLDQSTIDAQAAEFKKVKDKGHIPKTVVLVITANDDYNYDYDIVYGSHRIMAGRQAGTELWAMSGDGLSDAELMRIASAENLLRVDPNELEITEDILRNLEATHGFDQAKVTTLLSWNSKGRKGNNVVPQEWDALEAFLLNLPKPIKPTTFHKKYMPLLALPPGVMAAVRSGQLEYTKALELKKLPDPDAVVDEVVRGEWPLTQIKDYVANQAPKKPVQKNPVIKRLASVNPASLGDNDRQRLEHHLQAIEALLNELNL